MRAISAGTCQFHNHNVIVGEFHEVDIPAVLLEVGSHLLKDVLDFASIFIMLVETRLNRRFDVVNRVSTRFYALMMACAI